MQTGNWKPVGVSWVLSSLPASYPITGIVTVAAAAVALNAIPPVTHYAYSSLCLQSHSSAYSSSCALAGKHHLYDS